MMNCYISVCYGMMNSLVALHGVYFQIYSVCYAPLVFHIVRDDELLYISLLCDDELSGCFARSLFSNLQCMFCTTSSSYCKPILGTGYLDQIPLISMFRISGMF
jgi:hypothetical protein